MGASLLVFANKMDVGGCMNEDEIREVSLIDPYVHDQIFLVRLDHNQVVRRAIQGLQLDAIKTHKWTIIRCSGITGLNLQHGLQWVVQDARDRLFLY